LYIILYTINCLTEMSYISVDDDRILEDVLRRKEFYALKNTRKYVPEKNILPLFMVEDELRRGNNLQFHSYQLFVQNFMNVNTPYSRLLMKHSTGSGKTIGGIGIAMNFIKYYRQEELSGTPKDSIGSIYIIAFDGAKKAFQKDLLRFPSFGFATRLELMHWDKLRLQAVSNNQNDIDKVYEYGSMIKKRISNRKGNGFFKFIGYKTLVNRLFISDESLSNMTEDDIRENLKSGKIKYNQTVLDSFNNSLIICDEIHNVYNSLQKNNWGVALQIILDNNISTKAVFMSATPINNNPSEIVDLLNLLLPIKSRIDKKDFFDKKILKPGAIDKLKKLSIGRVSYLIDKNPKFFPSREFTGKPIKGIKYLKFIRCPFNKKHHQAYIEAYDSDLQTLSQESKYVMDFVLPNPKDPNVGLYKTGDLKTISMAEQKWKNDNNIDIADGVITGEFLQLDNLKNVSNKYFTMLENIISLIKNRQGKIMVYHNYVNMSGVLFIREILLRNGIIDEYMGSAANTLCSICGSPRKNHESIEGKNEKDDHTFKPVRFVIAHSELDKSTTEKSIDKYNQSSNSMGDEFMILLGSKIIKESYDLKAIRHMMIMYKPDNIPTLIQIMGRAVRKNSHITLPMDMHQVFVSIYTSSLPDNGLTYEEVKYKEKVADYEVIQSIEKIFHENALDAIINYDTIKPGLETKDLGDLDFTPTLIQTNKNNTFTMSTLNLSTFNIFHAQNEINLVTYIIKRAFLETSTVWKWEDLRMFVKSPSFDVEYDTSLIDDCSVVISLSKLLWTHGAEILNPYIEERNNNIDIIDKLFDPMDKRIIMPDGNVTVISQVGLFYMLLPIKNNNVNIQVDLPYRNNISHTSFNANITKYLKNAAVNFNYKDKRSNFRMKYKDIPIEKLSDAVCDYGVDFHTRFMEDCITYIFNSWTDWKTTKSEFHDFYFKMLYYYDIIGLIIFAHTAKEYIFNIYEQYVLPTNFVEKRQKEIDYVISTKGKVSESRDKQNLLNLIARNISKSSCDWCPQVTKELYEQSLSKSLDRFSHIKQSQAKSNNIVKVQPDILPIGHFLQKIPKFYHPDKGWFESPEYLVDKNQWIENPIIIGYNVKSMSGIHVRFKLRTSVQNIKIYKDARLIEKGSICSTRSKTFLLQLCKKLKLEVDPKSSITKICNEVKARLMYLELLERSRGTRLKFFYSHFEVPEDV
jgi:superfamily II DNA or RNA helicase